MLTGTGCFSLLRRCAGTTIQCSPPFLDNQRKNYPPLAEDKTKIHSGPVEFKAACGRMPGESKPEGSILGKEASEITP